MSKVLYYLYEFPQLSQTYVKVELAAVSRRLLVDVVATKYAKTPDKTAQPFNIISEPREVVKYVKRTQPDVLHSHWLYMAENLFAVAKATDVPFTIRAHSFDTLPLIQELPRCTTFRRMVRRLKSKWLLEKRFFRTSPWYLYGIARFINHPLCLGILSFPFSRKTLEIAGINSEKIIDCYPVVDFNRFYDRSLNGNAVMNVGITKPKKALKSYIDFAATQDMDFDLYAVKSDVETIEKYNLSRGKPVNIKMAVPFESMPDEYKKHRWLVYTAEKDKSTVGWPIIIAEAQAAGVVVCMQNVRPDLRQYLGGAGYLFESIEEIQTLIRDVVPSKMRERGFEQARKSDIEQHIYLLFDLWKSVIKLT